MYKYTVKYHDYNDVEREEDLYFNLTKAELMRMEMSQAGGMEAMLQQIIKEQDNKKIYAMFEEIVQSSYGVKSLDGRKFIKNQEVLDDFVQTEAYSEIVMHMLEDPDFANEFIRGIFPVDIQEQMAKNGNTLPKKLTNSIPAPESK